jgi:hypothetical protein
LPRAPYQQEYLERKEQEPKTANAVRVIDIPEVLAGELRDYAFPKRAITFLRHHRAGCCSSEVFFECCIRSVRWASMLFGDSG